MLLIVFKIPICRDCCGFDDLSPEQFSEEVNGFEHFYCRPPSQQALKLGEGEEGESVELHLAECVM